MEVVFRGRSLPFFGRLSVSVGVSLIGLVVWGRVAQCASVEEAEGWVDTAEMWSRGLNGAHAGAQERLFSKHAGFHAGSHPWHGSSGDHHTHHHEHGQGCIHDDLLERANRTERNRAHQKYTTSEHGRQLVEFGSIRIHLDTSFLEDGADRPYTCYPGDLTYKDTQTDNDALTYPCTDDDVLTQTKKDFLMNTLLPELKTWVSASLSVRPVSGNLVLSNPLSNSFCYDGSIVNRFACCEDQMPASFQTTGVPNADYVMHVTARPMRGSIAAWAFPCSEDQIGRPLNGQINFVPSQLSTSTADRRAQFIKSLHELFHNLGFSDYFFPYYLKPGTTDPIFSSVRTRSDATLQKTIRTFVMANAVEKMKEHFDCYNFPADWGVELEDQGTSATKYKHLEERVFYNELMSGWLHPNSVPSPVSLAFLQDSGWYQVDYSRTERLIWGNGEGCGFAKQRCDTWNSRYFCSVPNQGGCTPDLKSRAVCNAYEINGQFESRYQYFPDNPGKAGKFSGVDFCPIWAASSSGDCSSTTTARYWYHGEYVGSDSRCFMGDFQVAVYQASPQHHGTCLKSRCHPQTNLIEITLGPGTLYELVVDCPNSGGSIDLTTLSDQWSGTLECPPQRIMCTGNPCDSNDCDGHGVCAPEDGTCTCDEGYHGDDDFGCGLQFCPMDSNGDECGGHGTCDTTSGVCTDPDGLPGCDPGWKGAACDIEGCPEALSDVCLDPNTPCECSGRGPCVNGTCTCPSGWIGSDCGLRDCPSDLNGNRCGGSERGVCDLDFGVCECLEVTNVLGQVQHFATSACNETRDGARPTTFVPFTGELDSNGTENEPVSAKLLDREYKYFHFDVPSAEYDYEVQVKVLNQPSNDFIMPSVRAAYATFGMPTLAKYQFSDELTSSRIKSVHFRAEGSEGSTGPSIFSDSGTMIVAVLGYAYSEIEVSVTRDGCAVLDCGEFGECLAGRCVCTRVRETEDLRRTYGWSGTTCSAPDCPGTPDCGGRRGTCVYDAAVMTDGLPQCRCEELYAGEACGSYSLPAGMEVFEEFALHNYPTSPGASPYRSVNRTYKGSVDSGEQKTPIVVDMAALDRCCSFNGSAAYYVRLEVRDADDSTSFDAATDAPDPMLLTQVNAIATLESYDAFDSLGWSGRKSVHEVTGTLQKNDLLFVSVYNGRYATQRLRYSLTVEVSTGGCPPALEQCSGHSVGPCTGAPCNCEPGWEGLRCNIRAPFLHSGSVATVPTLAPGGWKYFVHPIVGTAKEIRLEMRPLQTSSLRARPIMVAALSVDRGRGDLIPKLSGGGALYDYAGFTSLSQAAVEGNATSVSTDDDDAGGDDDGDDATTTSTSTFTAQRLAISTSAATASYVIIGIHNIASAYGDASVELGVVSSSSTSLRDCDSLDASDCEEARCNYHGSVTLLNDQPRCVCDFGWSSDARCASPRFPAFNNLAAAVQSISYVCSICEKQVTLEQDQMAVYKVAPPLQRGKGVRVTVEPGKADDDDDDAGGGGDDDDDARRRRRLNAFNVFSDMVAGEDWSVAGALSKLRAGFSDWFGGDAGREGGKWEVDHRWARRMQVDVSGRGNISDAEQDVDGTPSLLVSETLPRSIVDFALVLSSSSTKQQVLLNGPSSTGSYLMAVYANTRGTFDFGAEREELQSGSVDNRSFVLEVWKWLTTSSGGIAVLLCGAAILACIVFGCVVEYCAPKCLSRWVGGEDERAKKREAQLLVAQESIKRIAGEKSARIPHGAMASRRGVRAPSARTPAGFVVAVSRRLASPSPAASRGPRSSRPSPSPFSGAPGRSAVLRAGASTRQPPPAGSVVAARALPRVPSATESAASAGAAAAARLIAARQSPYGGPGSPGTTRTPIRITNVRAADLPPPPQ